MEGEGRGEAGHYYTVLNEEHRLKPYIQTCTFLYTHSLSLVPYVVTLKYSNKSGLDFNFFFTSSSAVFHNS